MGATWPHGWAARAAPLAGRRCTIYSGYCAREQIGRKGRSRPDSWHLGSTRRSTRVHLCPSPSTPSTPAALCAVPDDRSAAGARHCAALEGKVVVTHAYTKFMRVPLR